MSSRDQQIISKEFKKRLYIFVLKTIKFINKLPKSSANKVISNQLLRSTTSILANYIEGGSASSRKEFINFFNYSLKSANESKVWVCLLRDTKQGNLDEVNKILDELIEISNIFAASIITLKKK